MPLFRGETLSCLCLPAREDAEQSSSKRDFFVSWLRKLVCAGFLFSLLPFCFSQAPLFSFILFLPVHFFFFFFHFACNVTLAADAQWESCVEWRVFSEKRTTLQKVFES